MADLGNYGTFGRAACGLPRPAMFLWALSSELFEQKTLSNIGEVRMR